MTLPWAKLALQEFVEDPKFLRVADMTGAVTGTVQGCFTSAMAVAQKNGDGSLEGLDFERIAWYQRVPVELVQAIFDAFVKIGIIAGEQLTNWLKRQGAAVVEIARKAAREVQEAVVTNTTQVQRAVANSTERVRRHRQNQAQQQRQGDLFRGTPSPDRSACTTVSPERFTPAKAFHRGVSSTLHDHENPHHNNDVPDFGETPLDKIREDEISPLSPPRGARSAGLQNGASSQLVPASPLQGEILMPMRGGRDRSRGAPMSRRDRMREEGLRRLANVAARWAAEEEAGHGRAA
jgi:hypothetical protein